MKTIIQTRLNKSDHLDSINNGSILWWGFFIVASLML